MTDFLETPGFPACPSFGYRARPQLSVTPIETASGHERRNRNWARFLLEYDCTVGPRAQEEIEELTEFWYALGGIECGFRFRDWLDYKSCRPSETATPFDQPLILDEDSPGGYQLTKLYIYGARTYERIIRKPTPDTIRLADAGVEKDYGDDWTIDTTTGLVTLSFSPAGVLSWGGEFDVPVRFNSEFPVELMDKEIQSVTFNLKELRRPS